LIGLDGVGKTQVDRMGDGVEIPTGENQRGAEVIPCRAAISAVGWVEARRDT